MPTRTLAENSHRQKQKEEETAAAGAEEEVGTAWGTVLVVERELAVEVAEAVCVAVEYRALGLAAGARGAGGEGFGGSSAVHVG